MIVSSVISVLFFAMAMFGVVKFTQLLSGKKNLKHN
ncbi:Hypothetical protein BSM4216_2754 [Bacillus smithii]|nr:Hypothetical protein BSM4216_2754 [Bacillus smithii]